MPPHIVRCERKLFERDEEGCVEAIVVFSVFEGGGVHVAGYEVDVQVGHGRVGVDAEAEVEVPGTAGGEGVGAGGMFF